MSRRPPVISGLIFEDRAILSGRPCRSIAKLEDKPSGLQSHERCLEFLHMRYQGASYVVGFANVDPLTCIRNSVDPRQRWRVGVDGYRRQWAGNKLLKWHWVSLSNPPHASYSTGRPL